MKEKDTVTILELRPDQRLVSRVRIPTTDEEKRNSRKLTNTGAEKILFDLSYHHVLYQGKNIVGSATQFDPAVVNIGEDFRSVAIYFGGATSTNGKDGSFIKAGLGEKEDEMSMSFKIGNNFETSKLIKVSDLKDEIDQLLSTRDLSLTPVAGDKKDSIPLKTVGVDLVAIKIDMFSEDPDYFQAIVDLRNNTHRVDISKYPD